MKTNRNSLYIGLSVIALVGLSLYYLSSGYQWAEHYKTNSEDPYGLTILHKLLATTDRSLFTLQDSLNENSFFETVESANYVYIGINFFPPQGDISQLLQYVDQGNQAFLFCKFLPATLMDSLYFGECTPVSWDNLESISIPSVSLNLEHSDLQMGDSLDYVFLDRFGVADYKWSYFSEDTFCEDDVSFAKLGSINSELINFVRLEYGDGYIYFHTTPIAFTNINLLKENAFTYANNVFAHLNSGDIYWDTPQRMSKAGGKRKNPTGLSEEGPFQYILTQPPLYWAWYLLLIMGLLFLVFRAKRRERVIPVLAQNKNTSLDFVRTIGQLYFLQKNHKQMALQKVKLFDISIKERYNLHFKEEDVEFEENLAGRSGVDIKVIQKICLMHRNINNSSFYVTGNTLIELSKEMDAFYALQR